MKKTAAKRMLAFLLAFVTILSGIQTFDLTSYAEGIDDAPIVQDAADPTAEVDDQTVTGPVNDAGPLNDAQESETAPDDAESDKAAEGEPAAVIASESAEPIVGTSGEERKVNVSITITGAEEGDVIDFIGTSINDARYSFTKLMQKNTYSFESEWTVGEGSPKSDNPDQYYDIISLGHVELSGGYLRDDNIGYWVKSITVNGTEYENTSVDKESSYHSITSELIGEAFYANSYDITVEIVKKNFWVMEKEGDKVVTFKCAATIEDAMDIVEDYYESHSDDPNYYQYPIRYSETNYIDIWTFRDIEVTDNIFLDDEGIAKYLHIGFYDYVSPANDYEFVYSNLIIPDGLTFETYVELSGMLSDGNGMSLVLGEDSVYIGHSESYFGSFVDETGTATIKLYGDNTGESLDGDYCVRNAGDSEHKLNKILLYDRATLEIFNDCYVNEITSSGTIVPYEDEDGDIWCHYFFPTISFSGGTAVIDSFNHAGNININENADVTFEDAVLSVNNAAILSVRGTLSINALILRGDDVVSDRWPQDYYSVNYFGGSLILPASDDIAVTSFSHTFDYEDPEMEDIDETLSPYLELHFYTKTGEYDYSQRSPQPGEVLFYAWSGGTDASGYADKVKLNSSKEYELVATDTAGLYKAQLKANEISYYYAYAGSNGQYPENTDNCQGSAFIESATKYSSFAEMINALKTASFAKNVKVYIPVSEKFVYVDDIAINNAKIKEIEYYRTFSIDNDRPELFVGEQDENGRGCETGEIKLYCDHTFRGVRLGGYGSGRVVVDTGKYNLTLIDSSFVFHGYDDEEGWHAPEPTWDVAGKVKGERITLKDNSQIWVVDSEVKNYSIECGSAIIVYGNVTIPGKIELFKNATYPWDSDARFELRGGELRLPVASSIIQNKLTSADAEQYGAPHINVIYTEKVEYGDYYSFDTKDFPLNTPFFYTKGADISQYYDKVIASGKNWRTREWTLSNTAIDGYYPAMLLPNILYYSYADDNGEFPDNTSYGQGLSVYDKEYNDIDELVADLENASFDGDRDVKVYIPITDGHVETFIVPANARIKEVEYFNTQGGTINMGLGDYKQVGGTPELVLNRDYTFRGVGLYVYNNPVINIQDHDLTLINSGLWVDDYFTDEETRVGRDIDDSVYKEIKGSGTLTLSGSAPFICNINVSNLVISGNGTWYRLGDNSLDYVVRPNINITMRGKNNHFEIVKNQTGDEPITINKFIVDSESSMGSLDIDSSIAYSINEFVAGSGASYDSNYGANLVVNKLTLKENASVSLAHAEVTGVTSLTHGSRLYFENYSPKVTLNGIELVKSATGPAKQEAVLAVIDGANNPIKLVGGIFSENPDDIVLNIQGYRWDNTGSDWKEVPVLLDARKTAIDVLYKEGDTSTKPFDIGLVKADIGNGQSQKLAFTQVTPPTDGYAEEYILKPIGFEVYSSDKNADFSSARLLSSAASYADAIDYINGIGNANQVYYVTVPYDFSLGSAMSFPKVGAGFGLVGTGDDVVEFTTTGNIVLPLNFTLLNVDLITLQRNATLNLNGKDLTLDNSDIYVSTPGIGAGYEPVVLTGTAGNLSVTSQNTAEFSVAKGNVSLKSLTLYNTVFRMEGKLTVTADVKVYNGGIKYLNGDSKIGGNLYLEGRGSTRASISTKGGTLTVVKDFYGLKARIVPYFSDSQAYWQEDMYLVANHKDIEADATPINFTFSGKTYLHRSEILATGNVTLNTVYSGNENKLFYGVEKTNFFKVNSVIGSVFNGLTMLDNYETASGISDFGWTALIDAGAGTDTIYKTFGSNSSTVFDGATTFDVKASAQALDVRRAFVEKSYYTGSYVKYAAKPLEVSNELALLYKKAENEKLAIVTTSESPVKFMVGSTTATIGGVISKASIYSLKAVGSTLLIDNTTAYPVVLETSAGQLVGRFETVNDAFAKITALKTAGAIYVVKVADDSTYAKPASTTAANLNIPKFAVAKEIRVEGSDSATIRIKDALALNTNVVFKDITIETNNLAAPNITLGSYSLELNNCNLKKQESVVTASFGANKITGSKNSVLRIDNDHDKFIPFSVLGDITGVDVLSLNNVHFIAHGKGSVGNLIVFENAGAGQDRVKMAVALNPGKSKVVKNTDGTFTGTYDFTPTFTVLGDIVNAGTNEDVFTVFPFARGKLLNLDMYLPLKNYVDTFLYGPAGAPFEPTSYDSYTPDFDEYKTSGIPLFNAPKAKISYEDMKFDKAYTTVADYSSNPEEEGMLIKKLAGKDTYLCYSSRSFAPYTLLSGDANDHVGDYMTWSALVKTIDTLAVKQAYTVKLNHGDELSPNSIETAEVLTMPAAKNISALTIESSDNNVLNWYYTGDKIALTCDTTFKNINFAGVVKDALISNAAGSANAGPLTVTTANTLNIRGKVSFNRRNLIFDGSGKKGILDIASDAIFANDERVNSPQCSLDGTIKNFDTVRLNGSVFHIRSYYASMANANRKTKGVLDPLSTAPELSATNLDVTKTVYVSGAITATNVNISGDGSMQCDGNDKTKVTITNLNMAGGFLKHYNGGTVDITNLRLSSNAKNPTIITKGTLSVTNLVLHACDNTARLEGGQITVKTLLKAEEGEIGFVYPVGKMTINGTVVREGRSKIYLAPYDPAIEEPADNNIVTKILSDQTGSYAFVTSAKATPDQFTPAKWYDQQFTSYLYDIDDNSKSSYTFLSMKGNVINGARGGSFVKTAVYTGGKGIGLQGYYASYADAVASMTDKNTDYYLKITNKTSAYNDPINVTVPAAAKAKSVTIYADNENVPLYYSKALVFANNVTLEDFKLCPMEVNPNAAERKTRPYVDGALPVTVNGAFTLTIDNARFESYESCTTLTAKTGKVVIDGSENASVAVEGLVDVKDLEIHNKIWFFNSAEARKDMKVSGMLTLDDETTLEGCNNVVLNNVTVNGDGRILIRRNTANGAGLTINGNLYGDTLTLWHEPFGGGSKDSFAIDKDELKNITKATTKVLFYGKNVESDQFVIKHNRNDVIDVCKANGAFYYVTDAELKGNMVELKKSADEGATYPANGTKYLDFTQAVNRINEIADINGYYEIAIGEDFVETNVTDTVNYSKLVLPGDSKCKKLTVKKNDPEAYYPAFKFSATDNVTVCGSVEFNKIEFAPVDKVTGQPAVTVADGESIPKTLLSITLKANSKDKTNSSFALINVRNNHEHPINTITGVKDVSKLYSCGTAQKIFKVSGFKEVHSYGGVLTVVNILDVNDVYLSKIADGDSGATYPGTLTTLNKSTVGNIHVIGTGGAAGSGELVTAYTESKGVKTALFTLTGSVDFTEGDWSNQQLFVTPIVALNGFDNSAYTMPGTLDECKGIPLLVAKNTNPKNFLPRNAASYDWFYNSCRGVMYRNLKGEVVTDKYENMNVSISASDWTYDSYATSWADAINAINEVGNKNAEYKISLLKENAIYYADANNGGKNGTTAGVFMWPKAGCAKKITISTNGYPGAQLVYTGALNPTCDVRFETVYLQDTKGEFGAIINVTNPVTLEFYGSAFNSNTSGNTFNYTDNHLTFASVTVKKGTLKLSQCRTIEVKGAVTVDNLEITGTASVKTVEMANKTYGKQTYGKITGSGTLNLENYFSKAIPTTTASQLSITGSVSPDVSVNMSLYNANYTFDGKTYKAADGYVSMTAGSEDGFVEKFLLYSDGSKKPVARTAILSAPFLSDDQLTVKDGNGTEYTVPTSKIEGAFYFTKLTPVVQVDTDYDKDGTPDRSETFLTWDSAVLDLNKTVNNDYAYKMTLLADIGDYEMGDFYYKVGEDTWWKTYIKTVKFAKLSFPAKVDSLVIDGNAFSFIFTNPALAFDSNIIFDDVSFICLKKTTDSWTENGKKYSVSNYTAGGTTVNITVSKDRAVTFNDYRVVSNISCKDEWGNTIWVDSNTADNITGSGNAKLVIAGSGFMNLNGKISGFDELIFKFGGEIYGGTAKASINVNKLSVFGDSYLSIGGDLTAKQLSLDNASIYSSTVTADELNLNGTATNHISAYDTGKMTVKNVHINGSAHNTLWFKQTAKGAVQSAINSVDFADGYADNTLYIGVAYPNGRCVSFYDGQAVFNTLPAFDASAVTLITADDLDGGHTCGEAGIDWHFEKSANGMQVIFKSGTAQ